MEQERFQLTDENAAAISTLICRVARDNRTFTLDTIFDKHWGWYVTSEWQTYLDIMISRGQLSRKGSSPVSEPRYAKKNISCEYCPVRFRCWTER